MGKWCGPRFYMLLAGMLLFSSAHADLNQARAALKGNNYPIAVTLADKLLLRDPGNVGALFVKGRALVQQDKPEDALSAFESIAASHPDIAPVWNNIGLLRASLGQHEAALSALHNAVRLDPDYALAQNNIGDIYAELAKRAHGKAKQLGFDSAQASAHINKAMAGLDPGRQLIGDTDSTVKPSTDDAERKTDVASTTNINDATAQSRVHVWSAGADAADRAIFGNELQAKRPPIRTASSAGAPLDISRPNNTATTTTVERAPANVGPVAQNAAGQPDDHESLSTKPTVAPGDEGGKPATMPSVQASATAGAPAASTAQPTTDVRKALTSWAQAWSAQDIAAYLKAYSADFQPANGRSIAAWRKRRRRAVSAPTHISVTLSHIDITMASDTRAVATFTQQYTSNTYADKMRKQLMFVQEKDGWRIVRED